MDSDASAEFFVRELLAAHTDGSDVSNLSESQQQEETMDLDLQLNGDSESLLEKLEREECLAAALRSDVVNGYADGAGGKRG